MSIPCWFTLLWSLTNYLNFGWTVLIPHQPDWCVLIMRPSSLGGGRILRHTLSVCPSVCPSVPLLFIYSRTVLRANIQNRKTSVFAYGPASRMYFSARTEGRISYGHLGRTNSCIYIRIAPSNLWEITNKKICMANESLWVIQSALLGHFCAGRMGWTTATATFPCSK